MQLSMRCLGQLLLISYLRNCDSFSDVGVNQAGTCVAYVDSHGDLGRLLRPKYLTKFIQISFNFRTHVAQISYTLLAISSTYSRFRPNFVHVARIFTHFMIFIQVAYNFCTIFVHHPTIFVQISYNFRTGCACWDRICQCSSGQIPENGFPRQGRLDSTQKVRFLKMASPGRGD